jgi:2-polyprenyl-3-methyl-5-hydroxy-6-metoxy-1,4-benzoquinol methylase
MTSTAMSNTLESVSDTENAKNVAVETRQRSEACPICGAGKVADLLTAPDRFHGRKEIYRLVRCQSCRSAWLTNPPTSEEMARHYTAEYHKDIVAAGEGSAASRWKNQVKLISYYKRGGAILDLGCSSGGFLSTMKGSRWKLYGIEMEESTAQRARATTGAEVFVGEAVEAPFSPASFDVITCFDVLEHMYCPRQILTKTLEWLRPGGIFYAMMPNIDSWEARLFGTHWYGLELPRHLFHFSPASLRHLMADLSFEEVQLKTPRVAYIERSLGYVGSTLLEKLGFSSTPQSRSEPRSLPLRMVRKAFRMAVVAPLAQAASMAGAGPSMEAVFRKAPCAAHQNVAICNGGKSHCQA